MRLHFQRNKLNVINRCDYTGAKATNESQQIPKSTFRCIIFNRLLHGFSIGKTLIEFVRKYPIAFNVDKLDQNICTQHAHHHLSFIICCGCDKAIEKIASSCCGTAIGSNHNHFLSTYDPWRGLCDLIMLLQFCDEFSIFVAHSKIENFDNENYFTYWCVFDVYR